ncbi:SIS domain-containing protein [Nakamurella endophytica]|uniref:Glucosamine-6-phosphate deaminase n=1 Tax=Nakamurella endophytica TaxID=1748367 RepID=A0A917SKR1_9ACTN|nr:SIS domain-containing protein [Nakamurella endophytica]GGL84401.1 glucosamine-6-phosphate deaminase [Nakamurella endophytica]
MPGEHVLSEMAEQPAVLAALTARRAELHRTVAAALPQPVRGVLLLARGSSDNVAVHARYLLELATGRPAALLAPSLVTRYRRVPDVRDHLVVALSQSGRTPEIVDVARDLAERGAVVVAVTNDAESPLAQVAAVTLAVGTGTEVAVPATKTVTGQLALVVVLAEAVAALAEGGRPGQDVGDTPLDRWTGGSAAWERLAEVAAGTLADERGLADAVELLVPRPTGIHLARGLTYAAALEGALKCKETSRRIHEGYSSADFLHGPLTVASDHVAVVAYGAAGPVLDDVAQTVRAAVELGSPVIGVGPADLYRGVPGAVGLTVPQGLGEALAVLPLVIRGQQLAVRTTLALGMDPDRPAGLNKVTATH